MKCCAKINDFICVSNTFILFAFLDANADHQKNNEKKSNKENATSNDHNFVNCIECTRTIFKIPFD